MDAFDNIKDQPDVKTKRPLEFEFKNVKKRVNIFATISEELTAPSRLKKKTAENLFRKSYNSAGHDNSLIINWKKELDDISATLKTISKGRPGVIIVPGTAGLGAVRSKRGIDSGQFAKGQITYMSL